MDRCIICKGAQELLALATLERAAHPGPRDLDGSAGIYVLVHKRIHASALLIAIDRFRPCKLSPPCVVTLTKTEVVTRIKSDHRVRGIGARTGIGSSYENEGVQRAIHRPEDVEII